MRDFTTDSTAAVYDYADKSGLVPDFVKQSSLITSEDVDGLPDYAFADEENRLFPCHTKEATVMSAIYFMAYGEGSQKVLDTIQKRASAFDVTDQVLKVVDHFKAIQDEYEQQQKQASQEEEQQEKYALTISNGDQEHSFYNITTRPDVLVSMNEVERDYNCGAIEMPWMRKIARVIMEAAEQFNVADNAPGCIVKFAECRLPDIGKATALLSMRSTVVDDMNGYNEAIQKLANAMLLAESFNMAVDSADEFAREVYMLDKEANVKYNTFLPDPYVVMLTGPSDKELEKYASEHVHISDVAVPIEDVVNLSEQSIDMQFSKQAASVIKDAVQPLRAGDVNSYTTSECAVKLASLAPDVRLRLLQVLANTGF